MVKNIIQKISYNLGIATLSRLVMGGFSIVIISILTRQLGPVGYGQYNAILAYLYVFTALADLGLYTILVREISKIGSAERAIASKIFTFRLISIILLVVLADLLVFFFPYPWIVKIGILIASIFSILSSLGQVLTGIFQKYLRLYFVSLSDIAARLFQMGVLVLLLFLKSGFIWFVWAVVFSEVVHFLMIFVFSRTLVKISLDLDWKYCSEIFKTALPIAASLVLVLIYFKFDTVLLSLFKPAYDVGVYSVAYKILETVIFLPAIYIGLVMPILSKHAFGDRLEFVNTFKKTFKVLTIFALPLSAYLFVLSDKIVRIIGGREFIQSGSVLKILSFAVLLIFFGNLGGNAIIALNLQKKALWIYFFGAVLNVGANVIFIPKFSYFAAAWTTVITEAFITFWMFSLIKKETGARTERMIILKAVAATLIMVALMRPFIGNFILASVVSLAYYPILFVFRGFSKTDLKEILSLKKPPELIGEIEN